MHTLRYAATKTSKRDYRVPIGIKLMPGLFHLRNEKILVLLNVDLFYFTRVSRR
jgi:hypothetical protein